jgi:hypothetical protein
MQCLQKQKALAYYRKINTWNILYKRTLFFRHAAADEQSLFGSFYGS